MLVIVVVVFRSLFGMRGKGAEEGGGLIHDQSASAFLSERGVSSSPGLLSSSLEVRERKS